MSPEGKEGLKKAGLSVDKHGIVRVNPQANKTSLRTRKKEVLS
jgi:hypothetical protein